VVNVTGDMAGAVVIGRSEAAELPPPAAAIPD
jgi:hypothetical protein